MLDIPLVSILIPVFNRSQLVGKTIESALTQTYSNIEVVAVDNASTDDTFSVLQSYALQDKRFHCSKNDRNIGASCNWQRCLELSHGEYIKLVFSDDWLSPNAIERMVLGLETHPEAGLCYSSVVYHNDGVPGFPELEEANNLGQDQLLTSYLFLQGFISGRISVPRSPGQALFRREDFTRWLTTDHHIRMNMDCGLYGMGNDCLLYLQACNDYPYILHKAEPLAHYRIHLSSLTIENMGQSMGELCVLGAFGHFLAQSRLPENQKRRMRGLLWVKLLFANPRVTFRWKEFRNLRKRYASLFPDDASASGADIWNTEVFSFAYRSGKQLLRKVWKEWVRRN
jgi:glycosyltransferase involved in cell wall biosynthesis